MKLPLTAIALLTLPLSLTAQTGFASPAGHKLETREGPKHAYWIGSRTNQTHQVIDADFRGKSRTITGILLRRDSDTSANVNTNQGRSFSNVTIRLATADNAKVTTNFSTNMTSSPTIVWSGTMSWPSLAGTPPVQNPAPWGGPKGEFRFTFAKNFTYKGTTDLLTEWNLTGGKLANGGSWPTFAVPYYLDGGLASTASIRLTSTFLPNTRLPCTDSANTFTVGAYMFSYGTVYGAAEPNTTFRNKVVLSNSSGYTAPNAAVIHAIGLAWYNGVDFGAKCNRLYIATMYPYLLVQRTTTNFGFSTANTFAIPWDSAFSDLRAAVQAVWTDSKTKQIGLSQAAVLQLPKNPPLQALPKRTTVYEFGLGASYRRFVAANDGDLTTAHFYVTK